MTPIEAATQQLAADLATVGDLQVDGGRIDPTALAGAATRLLTAQLEKAAVVQRGLQVLRQAHVRQDALELLHREVRAQVRARRDVTCGCVTDGTEIILDFIQRRAL